MAYTYSYDTKPVLIRGRRLLRVTLSESDVQTNSEARVEGLPRYGTLVRYKATLTPVAATQIDPAIGTVNGWVAASQDELAQNQIPDVHIDNQDHVKYFTDEGVFVIRNTPDANGDSIETEFYIAVGWEV